MTFNIAKRSRSTNHLEGFGSTQTGGIRSNVTVPTMRLDNICNSRPPPDFLTIDIEGAELEVLRGAQRLLRIGPTILIEVGSVHSLPIRPYSTLASTSLQDVGR
ncbi:MAG: FkbM family methyltransferase [Acidimicrobiales bacterium]